MIRPLKLTKTLFFFLAVADCSGPPRAVGTQQVMETGESGAVIYLGGPETIAGKVDKEMGFEFSAYLRVTGGPVRGLAELTPLSVPSKHCAFSREFPRYVELDNAGGGEATGTVRFASETDCWFQYRVRLAPSFRRAGPGRYETEGVSDDVSTVISFTRELDWSEAKLTRHQVRKNCEMRALAKLSGQQVVDIVWPRAGFQDLGRDSYQLTGTVNIEGVSYKVNCHVSRAGEKWYVRELGIPGKT